MIRFDVDQLDHLGRGEASAHGARRRFGVRGGERRSVGGRAGRVEHVLQLARVHAELGAAELLPSADGGVSSAPKPYDCIPPLPPSPESAGGREPPDDIFIVLWTRLRKRHNHASKYHGGPTDGLLICNLQRARRFGAASSWALARGIRRE